MKLAVSPTDEMIARLIRIIGATNKQLKEQQAEIAELQITVKKLRQS